jgi:hypothetical protein
MLLILIKLVIKIKKLPEPKPWENPVKPTKQDF